MASAGVCRSRCCARVCPTVVGVFVPTPPRRVLTISPAAATGRPPRRASAHAPFGGTPKNRARRGGRPRRSTGSSITRRPIPPLSSSSDESTSGSGEDPFPPSRAEAVRWPREGEGLGENLEPGAQRELQRSSTSFLQPVRQRHRNTRASALWWPTERHDASGREKLTLFWHPFATARTRSAPTDDAAANLIFRAGSGSFRELLVGSSRSDVVYLTTARTSRSIRRELWRELLELFQRARNYSSASARGRAPSPAGHDVRRASSSGATDDVSRLSRQAGPLGGDEIIE